MTAFFMRDLLRLLSQGRVIRTVCSLLLRLAAGALLLAGLLTWIEAWRVISHLPAAGILGGILFQIAFAVGIAAAAQVVWLRADSIAALEDGEFTVLPIASLLVRTFGEGYLVFVVPVAFGGGVFLWLSGGDDSLLMAVRFLLPGSSGSFLGGLFLMAGGAMLGFLVLLLSYLIAEGIVLLADIAKNARAIRRAVESSSASPAPTPEVIHA